MGREKTWAVTVTVDGEEVLTIEHNFLSGIPNIDDHADEVRTCAAHLLAFIGPGPEPDETVGGLGSIPPHKQAVMRRYEPFISRRT